MLAMGVFVIGFVAVLTLFPAAISLQKQTMDDLEIQRAVRDATNLLQARPWEFGPATRKGTLLHELPSATSSDDLRRLYPLLGEDLTVKWSVVDRSFPRQPMSAGLSPGKTYRALDGSDARYFWVPLIKRTKPDNAPDLRPQDWIVYLLLLRREAEPADAYVHKRYDGNEPTKWRNKAQSANATDDPAFVPTVMRKALQWDAALDQDDRINRLTFADKGSNLIAAGNAADGREGLLIKGGDQVLASNGVVYHVTAAHEGGDWIMVTPDVVPDDVAPVTTATYAQRLPSEIWFAPPPSRDDGAGNYRVDTSAPSPLVRVEVVKGAIR